MVVEQKIKKPRAAKKIRIIKDPDFSVVTHDGLVISCTPSKKPNKLYCVFSTVELQAYFGITERSLEKRESDRRREVADGEMRTIHIAIRNQGFENFVMFEVACFESKDEAAAAEKLHILNYKTYNAVGGCGYNSSPGGEKGGGYSEAEGKTRVNQIIYFYYAHNKTWPNKSSADEYEKSLGIALYNLRQARNNPEGGTNCKFYASYQIIADHRGVPDMFFSDEEHGQRLVKKIIDFYYKHNKTWPNMKSADEYEKSWGQALSNLRRARNNPESGYKFYTSYQNIADERGVPQMFFSDEELKNWGIEKFAQFIKDNGRPPQNSIKEEKTLYQWMQNRKRDIRSGNPKHWTPSNNETAIRFGVRHYFD